MNAAVIVDWWFSSARGFTGKTRADPLLKIVEFEKCPSENEHDAGKMK